MLLIDRTYFDGPILLPVANNEESIDQAIDLYHNEYLQKVMGLSLYNAFMAGIVSGGSGFSSGFSSGFGGSGVIDDRWDWIINGHSYTYSGYPYTWRGIRTAIANYVYWHYREDNTTLTATMGEIGSTVENGVIVSPDNKMVRAWNDMAGWDRELAHMLYHLVDEDGVKVYPEFNQCEPTGEVYYPVNRFGI